MGKTLLLFATLVMLAASACLKNDVLIGNKFQDVGDVNICCDGRKITFQFQFVIGFTFRSGAEQIKYQIYQSGQQITQLSAGQFPNKITLVGTPSTYDFEIDKPADGLFEYIIIIHVDVSDS